MMDEGWTFNNNNKRDLRSMGHDNCLQSVRHTTIPAAEWGGKVAPG